MEAALYTDVTTTSSKSIDKPSDISKTIIIGNGPAGMRCAQEILKITPNAHIQIFGNEPHQPYNRIQLSALLAGEVNYDDILTPLPQKEKNPALELIYQAITHIYPEQKKVSDERGTTYSYDQLVIATGSNPHVPNIPGVEQTGVYTFRNLKDTEALYNRVARARHILVAGGGLLGLEAARALQRANTKITIVQQGERLMNRQLDERASALLLEDVKKLGIDVIVQSGVRKIAGAGRVTGVTLRTGEELDCDTVLLCTGIKPEVALARDAGLKISIGIVVDDQLKTSNEAIYAIGECSEHLGVTYGLVNPGYEQAAIVANIICKGQATYRGSLEVSRLKVVGQTVCSMGEVSQPDGARRPFTREFTYRNKQQRTYRKIIFYKGNIAGVVGFSEWPELRRIQEAYQNKRRFWPWHYLRFWLTGQLFSDDNASVRDWPSATVVCQCNNITQGTLIDEIAQGSTTCDALQKTTGAGTVCGSCKPLLQNLLGQKESLEKDSHSSGTLVTAFTAIAIACVIFFIPGLHISDTVQSYSNFEWLWNDKFYKQVTGFSLAGITLFSLAFSLRRRLKNTVLGAFTHWRFSHVILACAATALIIAHTGLHLGQNLNFYLMINFLTASVAGGLTAMLIAISHRIKPSSAQNIRSSLRWGHILITWPLPILVISHIISVYYF